LETHIKHKYYIINTPFYVPLKTIKYTAYNVCFLDVFLVPINI